MAKWSVVVRANDKVDKSLWICKFMKWQEYEISAVAWNTTKYADVVTSIDLLGTSLEYCAFKIS